MKPPNANRNLKTNRTVPLPSHLGGEYTLATLGRPFFCLLRGEVLQGVTPPLFGEKTAKQSNTLSGTTARDVRSTRPSRPAGWHHPLSQHLTSESKITKRRCNRRPCSAAWREVAHAEVGHTSRRRKTILCRLSTVPPGQVTTPEPPM